MSTITVQRADERFVTEIGWLDSKHSFSFGPHYDATNTRPRAAARQQRRHRAAGTGFDTHPHRDMEIVTWVLSGELEHRDSEGNHGVLYPGLAQRMSAGTGICHSEMNAEPRRAVHFVQMWVLPDTQAIQPGYEQLDINAELAAGGLVPIASGKGHPVPIRSTSATRCCGVPDCRPASR